MTADAAFVFGLIVVAAIAMASNRIRFDVVALMVVLALILSGVLSVGEALAGFGSSVVILVAGLLVVGEMLARTGVARAVGDWILQRGGSNETRLLVLIMAGAGLLGAVMSSTAVVAIFIPIVLRIAAETNLNGARLLLPMSYAALISGMLTLIATTPNIVVHEELKEAGYAGLGFFSFTVIGLAILAVAILYVLFIGRRLLSSETRSAHADSVVRSIFDLWEEFRTTEDYHRLRINPSSPLANVTIADSDLQADGVRILGIDRKGAGGESITTAPSPATDLRPGDILLVIGPESNTERLAEALDLTLLPTEIGERQRWLWELGAAAVLVHPESGMIGKTLKEIEFRSIYDLNIVGLRRHGEAQEEFRDTPFQSADSLMVVGAWKRIRQLQTRTHDFVVTEIPQEIGDIVPSHNKMPIALAILVGMVGLTIFDVIPLVAAVLIAALAAVFTRCMTMEDAYESIHWSSIVLIAGMLPLADALYATGGTQLIVDGLMGVAGDSGPYVMMSVLFALTAALSLVLSNTASAVLVAPIAIYAAAALGLSPYPFAVTVLIAASCAYSTPVSTPVVTLVVDPGGYRFADFLKVGVPMLILSYLVTILLTPLVFPFQSP
jgi:di/tricarboxylate transporter